MDMLRALKKKKKNTRFDWYLRFMLLIFGILTARLVYLQLIDGDHYRSLSDGNRMRVIPVNAMRGSIYDRNGKVMVGSIPSFRVTLMESLKSLSDEEINKLAELLQIPPEEVKKRIERKKGSFEPIVIASDVDQTVRTRIEERRSEFPGISVEALPMRYYPYNEMAAQMIGYVGQINEEEMERLKGQGISGLTIMGRSGIESYYDDILRGKDGGIHVEVDAAGRPVKEVERSPLVPGKNMYLTIDLDLQLAAEKAITEQINALKEQKIDVNGVAMVAMDPNTGAVLAMVNRPSFDPNLFVNGISSEEWNAINTNPKRPLANRVISGEYPPGSTFKIVTGAAALELKKVTPEEEIYDSGRHWLIDMRNAEGEAFGWINFITALAKSDNVYFYEMGNRVGITELEKYARIFGLGRKTGIGLPNEASGLVASEHYKREVFDQDWYLGDTFNAAIGQGFQLVTPIQVAVMMSEVANGGIQYRPMLVNRIDNIDGTPYKIYVPEQVGTLTISKATMDVVRQGLRNVAEEGGTAAAIFENFPVMVAGKTGTAENSHGRDHGWFVAYAPYDKPKIVVVVLVEQGGFGVSSAGPIVRDVLEAFFHIKPPVAKVPTEMIDPQQRVDTTQIPVLETAKTDTIR